MGLLVEFESFESLPRLRELFAHAATLTRRAMSPRPVARGRLTSDDAPQLQHQLDRRSWMSSPETARLDLDLPAREDAMARKP